MRTIQFTDQNGTFHMERPDDYRTLYFPVGNEKGIKSAVTPLLGGDFKLDQNTFVLEPTSIDNLHNNRSTRNFWVITETNAEKTKMWSATGSSAEAEALAFSDDRDETSIDAGFMWQKLTRVNKREGLTAEVLSFVPQDFEAEIMHVTICNDSEETKTITGVAAIPLYGRSADNLRDHRHVTSLLHRIRATKDGILVRPTLSFDERGHQKNTYTYFVCGTSEETAPESFYPVVSEFIGENGTFINPKAIAMNLPGEKAGYSVDGREALGGLRFPSVTLAPKAKKSYTIILGATQTEEMISGLLAQVSTTDKVNAKLEDTKKYWEEQVNLSFHTGDDTFDGYMKWVAFQPFLRRIYGCSFLPHHDYGKGGRGWRDLWQDCLALLIMDPSEVGEMIFNNFGGVRMDGTNATIIGSKPGEFIADRNNITRVWMDHGMWPFLTTQLYIEQTGDLEILLKENTYFKDRQISRGNTVDEAWNEAYGNKQKNNSENVYAGTLIEHLLIQHMTSICEVGEHGNILLRGADWNDAIDMANHKGESVAFTCAYAGNLNDIALYLLRLKERGTENIELLVEFADFIDQLSGATAADAKSAALANYLSKISHNVSGEKRAVSVEYLSNVLKAHAEALMEHIRKSEWIDDGNGHSWFNSYYDDHANRVEGVLDGKVRMMLTGQVFSIMSGVASLEQVRQIADSADTYLYEKEIGGYRLNTDFEEEKYDMGRMFGFAYGEKENGAVFSHMTVMYAYALYKRGFVKEGYKALQTLLEASMNCEKSCIYPGVPEYFNNDGRGLYHYLTGAASWYALTMVTLVFGVHGEDGKLCFSPRLMPEQFDDKNEASIEFTFAGEKYTVTYHNPDRLDYDDYCVGETTNNANSIRIELIKRGE